MNNELATRIQNAEFQPLIMSAADMMRARGREHGGSFYPERKKIIIKKHFIEQYKLKNCQYAALSFSANKLLGIQFFLQKIDDNQIKCSYNERNGFISLALGTFLHNFELKFYKTEAIPCDIEVVDAWKRFFIVDLDGLITTEKK